MNKIQFNNRRIELMQELTELLTVTVRCDTCEHSGNKNICNLFDEIPPDDIRKIGCDSWEYSGIPF